MTDFYFDPGTGQRGGVFLPPGAVLPPAWKGPDRTYTVDDNLVSQDPADHGYGPEATHGPTPDNIHGGPFERALDACPECGCLEYDADGVGDASGEASDPDDLSGSESPQDGDYSVDPDEDHIDDSHVDGPVSGNISRGIAHVPNYSRPFRAVAGAVSWAADRPTTFTR
jgi:hypothetical protein